ncbi:hypothetical protein Bpfe_000131 [Biomphalaria pfeifferi]|uniref:Uncharacterized protein n=1 Tax=Biomphalaria pfeifferi TaxID=112525 RepID=A0AAD8CD29_BIOPF|nr:hypothetical protein Bpfe_000131 [Biomphalaria pfeifferi]
MKALDQKMREINERYSPQSLELSTTPARQDPEAEESKTTTHVQIGYTAQTDTEVAAKDETFIPDSPPLDNSTLFTQPNSPAQSNSPANCVAPNEPTSPSILAPPHPPTPSVKPQHHKAPIQQPAAHKDCNHPARKLRHNSITATTARVATILTVPTVTATTACVATKPSAKSSGPHGPFQ